MERVAKPAGRFNVVIEEAPVPQPQADEVRVRAVRSLISRGSEIGARYTREHAIDPERMGYSLAGVIDEVGSDIQHLRVGDRVVAGAPHAQYVVRPAGPRGPGEQARVVPMPDDLGFEAAAYFPLTGGAVAWTEIEEIQPFDTVVILGQGLVGSLMLQVGKANGRGRFIAVDALPERCALAAELGADHVIDAAAEDPVRGGAAPHQRRRRRHRRLRRRRPRGTQGLRPGPRHARRRRPAAPHRPLRGPAPAALLRQDPEAAPARGYYRQIVNPGCARRAMELLASGVIRTDRMTSHRFPYREAAAAFDLLYNRPGEAMGVLLDWEAGVSPARPLPAAPADRQERLPAEFPLTRPALPAKSPAAIWLMFDALRFSGAPAFPGAPVPFQPPSEKRYERKRSAPACGRVDLVPRGDPRPSTARSGTAA